MKVKLLISILIFVSAKLFGQSDGGEDLEINDSKFYSKIHTDSLIKAGLYFQTYYCGDFRSCLCSDSIAKKYKFQIKTIPYTGCFSLSKKASDTIKFFNDRMYEIITKINGDSWKEKFDLEVANCSQKICGNDKEIDSFMFGFSMFNKPAIMFDFRATELNKITKCILDYCIIKTLIMYPKINVSIEGNSTYDENDSSESISKRRALNTKKYLILKGVSSDRITVVNNGFKKGINSNDPKDKKNWIRKNRSVTFSFRSKASTKLK
ncbi:MAG: OmpA family protein [Bacteroidia bacterium]